MMPSTTLDPPAGGAGKGAGWGYRSPALLAPLGALFVLVEVFLAMTLGLPFAAGLTLACLAVVLAAAAVRVARRQPPYVRTNLLRWRLHEDDMTEAPDDLAKL